MKQEPEPGWIACVFSWEGDVVYSCLGHHRTEDLCTEQWLEPVWGAQGLATEILIPNNPAFPLTSEDHAGPLLFVYTLIGPHKPTREFHSQSHG